MDKKISTNPFSALFPSVQAAKEFSQNRKSSSPIALYDDSDQWSVNSIVEEVFRITIDKCRIKSVGHRPCCLLYLSEHHSSFPDECEFNRNTVEQAIFERVMMTEIPNKDIIHTQSPCDEPSRKSVSESRVIYYLHSSFIRLSRISVKNEENKNFVDKCREIIFKNVGTALTAFHLYSDLHETGELHRQLYNLVMDRASSIQEFVNSIVNCLIKEEDLQYLCEAFFPLFDIIKEKLKLCSFTDTIIYSQLSLLEIVTCKSTAMVEVMLKHSTPNDTGNGNSYESTLLGTAFSFSCIPRNERGPYLFFQKPSSVASQEHSITESNLWNVFSRQNQLLYELIYACLKVSNEARDATLTWLADCIQSNTGRTKISSRHRILDLLESEFVSDGFMLNLTSSLLHLCKPFVSADNLNTLMKVDAGYCEATMNPSDERRKRGIHLSDLSKETCLVPIADDISETSPRSDDDKKAYNFTTECFFMTHLCLYTGFAVIHNKLIQVSQDLSRQQRLYEEVRAQAGGVDSGDTVERIKNIMDTGMTKFLSLKSALLVPDMLDLMFDFVCASCRWLVNIAVDRTAGDERKLTFPLPESTPKQFSHIPEYVLENISDVVTFIRRFSPHTFEAHGESLECFMTAILVFMGNPQFVNNPHLRAKLAEMLECLMPHDEEETRMHSLVNNYHRHKLFRSHPYIRQLMRTLLQVFVSIEMTGQNVEFEQKFNYRRPMYVVLEYIWNVDLHRSAMKDLSLYAESNMESIKPPLFLRFINLLINDAIFLLDEALSYMSQLKENQQANDRHEWNDLPEDQRRTNQQNFHHVGLLARYHNVMSNETIHTLMFITEDIKSIFMHSVMVDRVAAMLNYFLVHLVGPQKKKLKVKDLDEYEFKPQKLVSDICQIYLNLGTCGDISKRFCIAVATDGRSYSPQLFNQAVGVLQKIHKAEIIQEFEEFSSRIKVLYEKHKKEEELANDIPDEYLDPIMSTLMSDPVLLPSSKIIVDRSTISRHLLSDQTDPFNRSPLTMDMVKSDDELKQRIEEWLKECKQS